MKNVIKMAEMIIIPPKIIPEKKKIPQKGKRLPEFAEKILKAEAHRKAKERKILEMISKQKAGKAAKMAKNAGIIKMAGLNSSPFRI
jgi:hypothetical protein